ncbi:MAG: Nitrogen-fixing NifU domain protein [Parcubacteria group bacterium GW2011_GWC2_39_14]|nr:MAG: Nitrogen-fixing NifU domain protein [Parcubacteria group bacterium GW2011_GWC2_39_14]KKR54497.1 MAG: Nitrogen-fixing NifU domain protein [Parcubacteria group bacterium GW2011_GWA2_40_23]
MKQDIEKIIKNIRGALQADGGDIELIEVTDDGVVKVALKGACAHCPMSTLTLKNFVEKSLKNEIPGIKEVISV